MKKLLVLIAVMIGITSRSQCSFTFQLNPPSPLSLTCNQTLVAITASPSSNSYTWLSLSEPMQTGTVATYTNIGTYSCVAMSGTTSCQQTFAVVWGTTQPQTTVTPASQAIDCNTNTAVTFSGMCGSPTINLQHDWYSPINPPPGGPPIATSNNTLTILSGSVPPGVYTLQTTNLVTGCKTSKTVTVTSLSAYPTFSMSSPNNFSVGCAPLNQTTLSIIGAQSTQTPPSICSFTFLPPGFTGTVPSGVPLSGNNSTVTQLPGTWTIIVQDNSNFCRSVLSIPVLQNTMAPNVSASMLTQTLLCKTPTVLATGTSSTANTGVTWLVPSTPPSLSTPTLIIGIQANGPNTSSTTLTYANYTVVGTNSLNACQSTSIVNIFQNFKPPISIPMISVATPTAIYCNANLKPAVLTTGSSTTTSGAGALSFVVNPFWEGPSPQTSTLGPSSYSCYVPGIYSLTLEDNYNGCKHTGTVNVLDRTQPPVITNPSTVAILDCGGANATATMYFSTTGTLTGSNRYLVTQYPLNTAFTPTSANQVNINPDLSGTTASVVIVDKTGLYIWKVTNTLTGCNAEGTVQVNSGGLTAGMVPDVETGYPPLMVSFQNISTSTTNNSSITTVWNFGNGSTATTTNANTYASTIYNAPGNYTVTIFATKGTCMDTAWKVIKIDIPSKMDVPNVFTPNGDGANDIFFMNVANLTDIHAIIFDRWGNKVYEVESHTGNISWDGKNQSGKECAAGVYFYVINAVGKDDKEYVKKGNVSLYR